MEKHSYKSPTWSILRISGLSRCNRLIWKAIFELKTKIFKNLKIYPKQVIGQVQNGNLFRGLRRRSTFGHAYTIAFHYWRRGFFVVGSRFSVSFSHARHLCVSDTSQHSEVTAQHIQNGHKPIRVLLFLQNLLVEQLQNLKIHNKCFQYNNNHSVLQNQTFNLPP